MTKLQDILLLEEGFRSKVYICTKGKKTIGVGRNLDDNPLTAEEVAYIGHDGFAGEITKEQAFYLLRHDIAKVEKQVKDLGDWVMNLNEDRYFAICSMCFQMGLGKLLKFKKMLSALAVGNYNNAADESLDSAWAKQTPNRARRTANCIRCGVYDLRG